MKSVYNLKGIYFRYTERWVLEDISFDVKEGEILGIIGPNGSGKSSLLKLLLRLNIPHKGEILLKDINISLMEQEEIARSIALVPQESTFLFPFTVFGTVLLGRSPHLRGRLFENSHDMKIAIEVMRWMDIEGLGDRPVTEISGGEKQRVIIARALAQEPEILILDEPTASLDIGHQVEIYNLITRLNAEKGLTVIITSHDLNLAAQYCHRLILLNKGRVYANGNPYEVISEENIRNVYGCDVIVDEHPVTGAPRVTLSSGVSRLYSERVY